MTQKPIGTRALDATALVRFLRPLSRHQGSAAE